MIAKKSNSHGIHGKLFEWIKSWLNNRVQRVVLNGKSSSWRTVLSGVPQVSVLGPILFLIYINDLDTGVMNWLLKFVDDTKIFSKVNTASDGLKLQKDLQKLVEWSVAWQMQFNVNKCKAMHNGKKNIGYENSMNGAVLEVVETEKDLGIMISHDLKTSNQCMRAYANANKIL